MPQQTAVSCDLLPAEKKALAGSTPGLAPYPTSKLDELRVLLEEDGRRAVARCSLPPMTEMMSYALAGGQCLRGLLLLAVGDCCGTSRKQSCEAAIAVEMLHAASLVVDDLPALDNTSMRRGTLSVHKRFGEAAAVLTAHALVAAAFEIVTQIASEPNQLLQITSLLARAIGGRGMARGELVDGKASVHQEADVRAAKTGSLFQAAAQTAALLADVDQKLAEQLGQVGLHLGVCYQLIDDSRDEPLDMFRESLAETGQLSWRQSLQLFGQVQGQLRETAALEAWLSRFYHLGAGVLGPRANETPGHTQPDFVSTDGMNEEFQR